MVSPLPVFPPRVLSSTQLARAPPFHVQASPNPDGTFPLTAPCHPFIRSVLSNEFSQIRFYSQMLDQSLVKPEHALEDFSWTYLKLRERLTIAGHTLTDLSYWDVMDVSAQYFTG